MTTEEMTDFIDSMTWEDCTVRLYNKLYWCLGVARYPKDGKLRIQVFEADPITYEGVRDLLSYASDSTDDCMKHFLEDKYWDGKSFYEVAADMEWVDL